MNQARSLHRVSVHEAAHAVVAWLLGWLIGRVTAIEPAMRGGFAELAPPHGRDPGAAHREALVVALIGQIAEDAYVGCDQRAREWPVEDDEDGPRARRIAEALGFRDGLDPEKLLLEAEAAAMRLVADARFRAAVRAFAAVLAGTPTGLDSRKATAEVAHAAQAAGLLAGSLPLGASMCGGGGKSHPPAWMLGEAAGHAPPAGSSRRHGGEPQEELNDEG